MSPRVIGYIRVSTHEQVESGAGLAAQRTTLLRAAEFRNLDLVEIIADEGVSAKTTKRPGLERALHMVRTGLADTLMVTKLDRLSRSLIDFATLMKEASGSGWTLIILEPDIDFSTPFGKLLANILASFAEFEADMISVRTKEGLAEKKKQGVQLGRRCTIADSTQERILREVRAGSTYRDVARGLTADRIPTPSGRISWAHQTIHEVTKRERALNSNG